MRKGGLPDSTLRFLFPPQALVLPKEIPQHNVIARRRKGEYPDLVPRQHTLEHKDCPVCERARQALMRDASFGELKFKDAALIWIDSRVKIGARTRSDYKYYVRTLNPFFGETRLRDIHAGMLRQYQVERKPHACEGSINKELGLLIQVRRRAGCEDDLEELYERLPMPYWKPPRTISDEQEQRFLKALRSRPEWEMVYLYAVIALNTGMRGCEIRGLRLGDIDSLYRRVFVRREFAKTRDSVRPVPLVDPAYWAVERALEMAKHKGSGRPEHFLFPRRSKINSYNPELPMTYSAIKKPWAGAAKLADVPHFTPHSSRHQVNEKLYTSGADDMTILRLMGHKDRQASEHYSRIRIERARKAMENALHVALVVKTG